MDLGFIPPGSLGDGESPTLSTWPNTMRLYDFAVPDELSGASELEKLKGLDKIPPRKRLIDQGNSFELSPFPHDHKRLVANRVSRISGPDNHMEYDMAKLCAHLVMAKHATRNFLPEALSRHLQRPVSWQDDIKIEYSRRRYERNRNDFLSEYCYRDCHSDVIPVRPDEIALWNEWSMINPQKRWGYHRRIGYMPLRFMRHDLRVRQFELLTNWCNTIPDVAEKYDAFRTLAAFSENLPLGRLFWCSVCEYWNPKPNERLECDVKAVPFHVCHMGKVEYLHRLELLKLTAKFCQRVVKTKYEYPKL
ncbi:hypothetical protein DICA2_A03466 [Diutina catenulata]